MVFVFGTGQSYPDRHTRESQHMHTFPGISAGPCMDPFLEEERRDSNLLVSRSAGALVKKMVSFLLCVFARVVS